MATGIKRAYSGGGEHTLRGILSNALVEAKVEDWLGIYYLLDHFESRRLTTARKAVDHDVVFCRCRQIKDADLFFGGIHET